MMIEKRHILELRERVSRFEQPVLSVYATVNTGLPEVNPNAVLIRVKNALKRHPQLPSELTKSVLEHFDRLRPESRSLAVFADVNGLEALAFEVSLVDDISTDEVELHYGEPYFTPLLVAMDQHEPYMVAYADQDRVRLFQVFMGQIQEDFADEREKVADEQDDIETSKDSFSAGVRGGSPANNRSGSTSSMSKDGPDFVADRADASRQLMQERVAHSQAMFYKDRAAFLSRLMDTRGIRRLVLMGPDRDAHMLMAQLPAVAAQRVVSVLPSLKSSDAPSAEVLERVKPVIAQVEAAEEQSLIEQIRERGMWGLDQCLRALQEGRLHTVAVPSHVHQQVFMAEDSHYIALSETTAQRMGEHIEKIDLADKLPDLAAAGGARLEFVHGEAQTRLIEEFGGMAGLRRW